ncbi:MAG: sigma 54-interacting transcriptional regulator, partial [Calditrichota bacterium]
RFRPGIDEEVEAFYEWLYSDRRFQFHGIVGASRQMQRVFELIHRVAETDITVLIQGETGTGKEVVARAIHSISQRQAGPFVTINCGAIPETLLESELFGHVKGAFTGADIDRKGLLKEAAGGTVFLDEIGETSQMFQVKLLRALQEREITPLGSNIPQSIDVRIIAATGRNLQQEVERGTFRSDLYYRINVVTIQLPPLRERKEDILPLVRYFIKEYNIKMGKKVAEISDDAAEALAAYHWKGNVRELENVIERAIALSLDHRISLDDLPDSVLEVREESAHEDMREVQTLEEIEKQHIQRLLQELEDNYNEVAEKLGIGRTTLWRKMKKYGLERED